MDYSRRRTGLAVYWPRLSYHYGLSFVELATMPRWAVQLYLEQLPELLAETRIGLVEAASYPHLTNSARQAVMRELTRALPGPPPVTSPEAYRMKLAAAGIQVVQE